MTREIRVHMDTLEYTRDGLRTRDEIQLQVGRENRVVLVRPDRVKAVASGGVAFPQGSSFPLPGLLTTLWVARQPNAPFTHHTARDPGWNGRVVQIYGHCESAEADAKALSERRARVTTALMNSDPELFEAACGEEQWGDWTIQSMLRTLACDPGPVDGAIERLTMTAVRAFVERYNRGVYAEGKPPAPLAQPEALDDTTRQAIRGAFVASHGLGPDAPELLPHHATHGCCAFNRAGDRPDRQRRATVLTYAHVPPLSENAPCSAGDEQACAVVDDRPNACMWFREHTIEKAPADPRLFDPRWLWIRDDRYVLSALTTADDGEAVVFEISGHDSASPYVLRLEGIVRAGVAAVVWASGLPYEETDGRPSGLSTLSTPHFRAYHPAFAASETAAAWPERESLEVMQLTDDLALVHGWSGGVRVTAQDGSYDHFTPYAQAIARSTRHAVLVFPDVPTSTRIDVIHESGDLRRTLLRGVVGERVAENCATDEQCSELPPAPPPPDYSLDEVELDEYASTEPASEPLPPFELDPS